MTTIFIRKRTVDKEEAKQVLAFFAAYPERQDCVVGYDRGETFTGVHTDTFQYTRGDIPALERICNAETPKGN